MDALVQSLLTGDARVQFNLSSDPLTETQQRVKTVSALINSVYVTWSIFNHRAAESCSNAHGSEQRKHTDATPSLVDVGLFLP